MATKTETKEIAQDLLMDAIGNVLGYWEESGRDDIQAMTEEEKEAVRTALQAQANRIARMFGYEKAWSN